MTAAAAPRLLALDVAVLPPAPCRRRLADLNARLAPPPAGFRFDDTHLAHVTLAQQFVAADRLDDVARRLADVARGAAPLRLRLTGLRRGRATSSVGVAPAAALDRLHAGVMDALLPFDAGPGGAAAFLAQGEPPRPEDVEWVNQFRSRAAYARFDPHVTLGVGAAHDRIAPFETVAARIALCRLGRYCTCRRVLAEWRLTPRRA